MNHICAKADKSFGRDILSVYIDNIPIDMFLSEATGNSSYPDLWCAWLLNDDDNESKYIWTLLDERRDCNIPILLCPDDMDFSCIIIVAQVRFSDEIVTWKIGAVTEEIDVINWRQSGIQNIASWSDSDWAKYGGTLATLGLDDIAWEKWWFENWPDEENRRIWNYYHPYFNNDDNISWLPCPTFTFPKDEYDACVAAFKSFQY